jgi:Ca2+-binding EF-hand superfamily protein
VSLSISLHISISAMSSLKKSGAGASKSGSSRGGAQRAELTEEQKQEIKEAFDLFDTGQQQAHRQHTTHVEQSVDTQDKMPSRTVQGKVS